MAFSRDFFFQRQVQNWHGRFFCLDYNVRPLTHWAFFLLERVQILTQVLWECKQKSGKNRAFSRVLIFCLNYTVSTASAVHLVRGPLSTLLSPFFLMPKIGQFRLRSQESAGKKKWQKRFFFGQAASWTGGATRPEPPSLTASQRRIFFSLSG